MTISFDLKGNLSGAIEQYPGLGPRHLCGLLKARNNLRELVERGEPRCLALCVRSRGPDSTTETRETGDVASVFPFWGLGGWFMSAWVESKKENAYTSILFHT